MHPFLVARNLSPPSYVAKIKVENNLPTSWKNIS